LQAPQHMQLAEQQTRRDVLKAPAEESEVYLEESQADSELEVQMWYLQTHSSRQAARPLRQEQIVCKANVARSILSAF
jgi:hypothetical protein